MAVDALDHAQALVAHDPGELDGVHPTSECLGDEGVPQQVRVHPLGDKPNALWDKAFVARDGRGRIRTCDFLGVSETLWPATNSQELSYSDAASG